MMRCAIMSVFLAGFCASYCLGDEKELRPAYPQAPPPTESNFPVPATNNAYSDPIFSLVRAIEAIEKRLSEFDKRMQQESDRRRATPPLEIVRDPMAVGIRGQQDGSKLTPPMLPDPIEPRTAGSPLVQPHWKPDTAPRIRVPSKPRVAQETRRWQELEIDGKGYYLVPTDDVLHPSSSQ